MRGITFRVPSETFAKEATRTLGNSRRDRFNNTREKHFMPGDKWWEFKRAANILNDHGVNISFWPLNYPTNRNHAYQLAIKECGGEVLWKKDPFKRSRRRNGICAIRKEQEERMRNTEASVVDTEDDEN